MEKLKLEDKKEENEKDISKLFDNFILIIYHYYLIYFISIDKTNPLQKRRSLKDEFSSIINIKKVEPEELSPETIAETMKNTLYNKVVGKISEEEGK